MRATRAGLALWQRLATATQSHDAQHPPPLLLQGKRYTLREFQEAAAVAAAKRLGGLVGCLPARTIEVRAARGMGTAGRGGECRQGALVCARLLDPPPTHTITPTPLHPVQREYWRERGRGGQGGAHAQPPLYVEYGSDVDGTLFVPQDALGATRWNLNVRPERAQSLQSACGGVGGGLTTITIPWHRRRPHCVPLPLAPPARPQVLPCEPGSALRLCAGAHIPGVSAPMLYCGQLFSTFAWHVEVRPGGWLAGPG